MMQAARPRVMLIGRASVSAAYTGRVAVRGKYEGRGTDCTGGIGGDACERHQAPEIS
jgi:hypothetical protein